MKILTNLGNFFSKNKKNIIYTLAFFIFIFSFNDIALAADPKEQDVVIKGLNLFMSIASSLLGVLTMFIGLFLRPEWTSGSVIGLDTQLKTMWILISNVVYFIFAFIFITIAFMNIIGKGDNYELKKAIPKFIVGVIMVPFSWFFVQFILSISGILTVAVLSLPYSTFPALKIEEQKITLCTYGERINISSTGSNFISCTDKDGKALKPGEGTSQQTIKEFIKKNDNGGLYSIMTIYTYSVMKLDEKGLLYNKELLNGITDVWGLGLKIIFDLIFIIVYVLLLIALFLAFMTRGFALWFYTIFSPVFGLLYYFGKGKEGIGEGAAKKFNLTEFIGLAFVPVYVAAALSFGILFLFVAGQGFSSQGAKVDSLVNIDKKGNTLKIGTTTFTLPAVKTSDANNKDTLFEGFTGPIGAMILEMLGLAIMWLAVMAALKQSTITGEVTKPIADFGGQIGDLIKKAPTYAPIIPTGSGMMSAEGLKRVGAMPGNAMEKKVSDQISPFQQKIDRAFGVSTIPVNDIATIKTKMDRIDGENELKQLQGDIRKMAETYGTNSSQFQNLVKEFNEKIKANPSLKDFGKNTPLFDGSGKLTKDGVLLLHDNNSDKSSGERAFTNKWAENNHLKGSGTSSSVSTSTTLPPTIKPPEKLGDKNTFNIYAYNKDGKQEGDKTDITIDKGKVINGGDIAKALDSYKTKEGENGIRKILTDMGIKPEEIDIIIKKMFPGK